jgi:hypothetical protein
MGFIAVVWTFHFSYGASKRRLDARMVVCVPVFCGALLAAGILLEGFTVRPGSGRDLVVCGYSVLPELRPLIAAGDLTPLKALRGAEYDPYQVWTRASVIIVHVTLVTCWLLAFVSFSMFLATFIILQKRRS